jgi:hypothetical protein
MKRFRWKWLIPIGIVLGLFVVDSFGSERDVLADLEIEFVVRDSYANLPVPNAKIEIVAAPGCCGEPVEDGPKKLEVQTSEDGRLSLHCSTKVYIFRSGLGIRKSYFVTLPDWKYDLTAVGYQSNTLNQTDTPQNQFLVKQIDETHCRMIIYLSLRKKPAAETLF